ncbi:MAG: response regulator transcription factor [Bacteroidales bacterium]|nr:response regulator transcription factor [Bacteroidales bacterium]
MKILVIEDERKLSDSIVAYLSGENYLCEQAFTYAEAKQKANIYEYDCVLLDLMLPGGDGLDILSDLRRRHNPVGVIIISAKDALDDKLRGLQIGADDYLPKPFHMAELSMRVYAVIRRREFAASNIVAQNGLRINLLDKSVEVDGQRVELTKSEYELLLFFLGNRNRVISKSAMAEHLSGDMADMMDNHDFVYTHIKNLKAKLAAAGCKDCIKNVYGTGYRWTEV